MKEILKNKKLVTPTITALGGFTVGLLVNDIPYVQFKREVDLSTIVSIFGLIGAIYIVPFLINTYFSQRDNTKTIVVSDLDRCLEKLEIVAALYKRLYISEKAITKKDMKELLSDLRRATNCMSTLALELDKDRNLKLFRTDVFAQYNEKTYKDHTENTRVGVKIDDANYLSASASIEDTISRVKKYKYLIYSD